MDYEKAYKEALARAKDVHDYYCDDNQQLWKIESIFPELKENAESEDEQAIRIIKKRMCYDPVPISDEDRRIVEDWLEKQKINTEGDFGRGYDCGHQAGYAVAKNEMKPKVATATLDSEKQKEQKPVEIDEEINRWMGCEAFPEGTNITPLPQAMEIVERTAKHFFELGEKTVPCPGGYWEGFRYGVRECQNKIRDVKDTMKEQKPRLIGEDSVEKKARQMYETGQTIKEQKLAEGINYSCPDCGTTSGCANDESEYDRGYREGHRFGLKQTQEYMLSGGKTFSGLIPCWVNAPSTSQPAHKYHGRNAVIMHENNGGFRCCFIDDEKATTVHLPENTLFVEGWRKKPTEWSEEDEKMLKNVLFVLESYVSQSESASSPSLITTYPTYYKEIDWLKSLRPSWKPSEEQMKALQCAIVFMEIRKASDYDITPLKLLYEHLKKLIV